MQPNKALRSWKYRRIELTSVCINEGQVHSLQSGMFALGDHETMTRRGTGLMGGIAGGDKIDKKGLGLTSQSWTA